MEKEKEVTLDKINKNIGLMQPRRRDNQILTAGGRVLNVCAFGDTLKNAAYNAYLAVGKIGFENIYYRKDIGYRAFRREE